MDGRETKMKKKKKKNSGSKMSNKLVHWWLEKFKSSVSSRLNKTGEDYDDDACETQSTISLPRSSLYKLASKRLSELPVFDTGDSQKVQVLSQILYPQAEVFNNSNKLRPESSSKVVESSVSAGCSCGAGISAYTASKWQKKKSSNKFKIEGSDAQKASTTRSSSVASVKNKTMADSGVPKVEELQRRQVIQEHHRSCCCKCSAFCCTCRLSMCPEFKHLQLWSDEDEDYEDDDSSISEVDDVPFLSSSSSSNRATATYDCTRRLVVDMKLKLPLGDFRESSASLFRRPDSDALDSHAQAQAKIRQMILDRPNNFLDCYNNQLVHTFSRGVAAVAQSKKCLNAIERFKDRQVFHEPPMAANLRSWNVQLPGTTFSQERQPEPEDLPEVKNQSMKTKKIIHSNTSSSPSIKKSAGGGNCSSCGKPKKEGNRNAAADVEANTALNPDSESQRLLNKGGAVEEECALKRSLAEQAKEAESESQTKLGESFAMVKASYDPERDFRESMVEMMVENDIRDPRDLQELLNCYLSLNSVEYHRLILQVFEEIQSDLLNIDP